MSDRILTHLTKEKIGIFIAKGYKRSIFLNQVQIHSISIVLDNVVFNQCLNECWLVFGDFRIGQPNQTLDILKLRWSGVGHQKRHIKFLIIEFNAQSLFIGLQFSIEIADTDNSVFQIIFSTYIPYLREPRCSFFPLDKNIGRSRIHSQIVLNPCNNNLQLKPIMISREGNLLVSFQVMSPQRISFIQMGTPIVEQDL